MARTSTDIEEIRTEAGRRIDPTTAETTWVYGNILDPFGDDPGLPDEHCCIGRVYFAREPDSNEWVCFYDLPSATRNVLEAKVESFWKVFQPTRS
jgi:hypothetical protein